MVEKEHKAVRNAQLGGSPPTPKIVEVRNVQPQ